MNKIESGGGGGGLIDFANVSFNGTALSQENFLSFANKFHRANYYRFNAKSQYQICRNKYSS